MIDSEEVKRVREALGESQMEFAERFGVNQSTVCRWEMHGIPDVGTAKLAVEHVLAQLRKRKGKRVTA